MGRVTWDHWDSAAKSWIYLHILTILQDESISRSGRRFEAIHAIMDQGSNTAGDVFGGRVDIAEGLKRLRLRLLDLTSRNRLLNFRHVAGRMVRVAGPALQPTYDRLISGRSVRFAPVPEPTPNDIERPADGPARKPRPEDYARAIGLPTHFEERSQVEQKRDLQALFYPDDLERMMRKIASEARTAIEETGTNCLHLIFGFLEYTESDNSDSKLLAPLVAAPVTLTRSGLDQATRTYRYELKFTGEDIADNLSLREKLSQDFALQLPPFDADRDAALDQYLLDVARAVKHKPAWTVRRFLTLAPLSFGKMLLFHDLDPRRWPQHRDGRNLLLDHEIVRMVFQGCLRSDNDGNAPEPDPDDHPEGELPLIADADSSQHAVLTAALAGRNIVVEGPPGTGKSQTITNLIAAAMQRGKTILFVSEKMAALEVVKQRLEQAGLGEFCLELHGMKTSKQKVLDAVRRRLNRSFRPPRDLPGKVQTLERHKRSLKQYAALMGVRLDALEMTVHDVLWAVERYRVALGSEADALSGVRVERAESLTRSDVDRLADLGAEIGRQFAAVEGFDESNPWWGFYPCGYAPGDDVAIGQLLDDLQRRLQSLWEVQKAFRDDVASLELALDAPSAEKLHEALRGTNAEAVDGALVERIFCADDAGERLDAILRWADSREHVRELNQQAGRHVDAGARIDAEIVERFREAYRAVEAFGLQGLTLEEAVSRAGAWRESCGRLAATIRICQAIADAAGQPFDGKVRDVFVLGSVVDIAASAPRELLSYRAEPLAGDEALLLTEQLKREHGWLAAERRELDGVLYLDTPVSGEALMESVRTLRQGDAWYRVFQADWRKAVKLHRSLSRGPKKRAAAERCAELERLARYLRERERFASHSRFRSVFGPLFEAEKTNTARIERLVRWLVSSRAQLARLHIPARLLDIVTVSEAVLAHIAAYRNEADHASDTIRRIVKEIGVDVLPRERGVSEVDDVQLSQLGSALEERARALAACAQAIGGAARPGSTLEAIKAALDQRTIAEDRLNRVANDEQVAALLGPYFRGAESDLGPVVLAREYVRHLTDAGIPPPFLRRLTRSDLAAALPRLTGLAETLVLRWREVAATEGKLKRYADVRIEDWARTKVTDVSFVPNWARRAQASREALNQLPAWARYLSLRREAGDAGLGELVSALEAGRLSPERSADAVRFRVFASVAQHLYRRYPELQRYGAAKLDTLRNAYASLDREIVSVRGCALAHEIAMQARPAEGSTGVRVDDKTEMALIRHLLPLSRPRIAVRQLLCRAGRAMQELMPCFMMSPLSVAQYLAPGVVSFDLVVMDEASQLKPEEAIGAIARGRQLVVVGDPKQLPPTSFFDRYDTADDDAEVAIAAADVPSILDVCIGHLSPVRRLRWHYRSRHESLIAFSNLHFYDNDLIVFPSPATRSAGLGIKYRYVRDGVYDSQMNQPEALAVVQAVLDHIVRRPDESLGIVTLNLRQRDLIEELLEQRFKNFEAAEAFEARWQREGLPLFVKNLENVQGDERDVIFISTTFGPAPGTNVVRQNFGPISRENGWRRLNVLFTRARKAIHVFSSMRPDDIVIDANTPRGTKALAAYLNYARSGVLHAPMPTPVLPESDFEVAVKSVIESEGGYEVVPQLGVGGFRIDLAVRHPERPGLFMAAIECDGASYHTGRSVRDRDRIRQEILESLGWKNRIYRIWSTDWFESPARQTKQLLAFLEAAKALPFPEDFLAAEDKPVEGEESTTYGESLSPELANEAARFVRDAACEVADLVVENGDTVTFAAPQSGEPQTVQIRDDVRDLDNGVIPVGVPLAQALLGAAVGDVVPLRVPGRTTQELKILRIVKPDGRNVSLEQ